MKTASIGDMVRAIQQLSIAGDLSEWEAGFALSVYGKSVKGTDTSRLTEKQVETVESIYSKHF